MRLIATALALMVPIAACANNGPRQPTGQPGDLADADRSAILRLSAGLAPPSMAGTLDPIKSIGGCDISVERLIYGTLTKQTANGPEPWLAESWTVVDPTTLDLHLQPNAKFHNGEPFNAEAVKAGLDRNRAEGTPYTASLSAIEEVEVVDEKTVRIRMNRPAAGGLLATFASREGLIPAPASLADPDSMANAPIGAGPFKVEEFTPGESLKLRRFDDYYDPDQFPYAGIDYVHLTDVVAVRNAILAGDLDLGFIDIDSVSALQSNPRTGAQVNRSDAAYYVNLNTSLSDPPLDNLKVRQALNYAFNREAIAKAVYGPSAEPKWQIFPAGYRGHDPELEGYYAYDPEKAKQLLAEAGYPNGFKMTMQAFPPPNPSARTAEALKADLAKIGVELEIVTGPNMTQDYHIDRKTHAGQNWWIPRSDPTITFLTLYGPVGILNASEYDNPELNELVYDIQGRTDPADIDAGLREASRIIVEEAREIGVVYTPSTWGYSSRIGFKTGQLIDYGNSCNGADLSSIFVKKTA